MSNRPTTPAVYLPMDDPSIDWSDFSTMKEMTCKNHTGARYLTKNPWQRGLHFVAGDPSVGPYTECPCSFNHLVVVVR